MFWNNQNTKFPRLTSWLYVFNVTRKSVNKQHYWVASTLVRPNGVYVGVAQNNRTVHEGMKDISNVKVHLKTGSGNVNIAGYTVANFWLYPIRCCATKASALEFPFILSEVSVLFFYLSLSSLLMVRPREGMYMTMQVILLLPWFQFGLLTFYFYILIFFQHKVCFPFQLLHHFLSVRLATI